MQVVVLPLLLGLVLVGCTTVHIGSQRSPTKAATFNAELGANYLASGNLQQAKVKLDKAIEQDPENARALGTYALLMFQLGKTDEAGRYFKQALQLAPEDSELHNSYGTFLCSIGETEAADRQFLSAAENPLYRTPEFAYSNAGVCAMEQGNLERAEEYYRLALQKNPRFAGAVLNIAELSFKKRRYDTAEGYLQRYHELSAHTPDSLWLAVLIYRELGDRYAEGRYAVKLKTKFPESDQTKRLRAIQ